ncbi:sigma-70 family RNA polymerase sigma factor [Microbacteriaceae bacterium K1510]|nr:sigma-70 family RNA polymerase sigma factor [Microbacteriaceae bacterium K1510]
MTENGWAALRQLLVDRYEELRKRLTRRLGSEELARETLHETWLHLHRKDEIGAVASPTGYVLRTAFNLATDRGREESRLARRFEIRSALESADEAPGPARQVEARLEIAALEEALDELSERQRTILLASRLEAMTLRQIATALGVSQRLVEMELKVALEHCAARLGRVITRRFGPKPRGTSSGQAGNGSEDES